MADFKGILPAPKIVPLEFGLFSAFNPVLHADTDTDSRWIRGFQIDYETTPSFVRNWDHLGLTSDVSVSRDGRIIGNQPRFIDVDTWFIEVEDNFGALAAIGLDRFERVKRQLEAVTQKMVERELAEGTISRARQYSNPYLARGASVTVLNSGTALSAPRAVALLEHTTSATSSAGVQGTLHVTRDVAALLGSQYMLVRVESGDNTYHIETNGGTTVVLGSGYTGNGPAWTIATSAALSNATAWTFTTDRPHFLAVGETVVVSNLSGIHAPLNGTYTTVTGTTASTVAVTLAANATIAAATSGAATLVGATVQMQATASTKWIYATGTVDAHLGPIEVVNENLGQAWDITGTNDMRIKATRPAVAYFDPSIHLAVKVDLTTAF